MDYCARSPHSFFGHLKTDVNQLIKINHHCDFGCCYLPLLFLLLLFEGLRKKNYAQLLASVVGFRNRELPVPFNQKKKCRQETVGSIVVLILVCIGSGKELGQLQQIPVQMMSLFYSIPR